jgi:hypothetical protein
VDRSTRRDDGEMPVFDADAPITRGVRPNPPSFPGRRSGSTRGVGLAVAALVLLTAGVAAGGILETTTPSPSSSSSGATPSDGSLAATDGPCVQTPLTRVPPFVIGVEGSTLTASGRAGYSHRPDGEERGPGWIVPTSAGVIVAAPSGAAFEVRTTEGACVRHILAAYASALFDHPEPSDVHRLADGQIEPPTQSPTLGTLPDGDWVIRVLIHFETGDRSAAGLVAGERFFRVRVGSGPFPTAAATPTPEPTPRVTPSAACKPAPTAVDEVDVVLAAPGDKAVAGVQDGASPPVVELGVGEVGELSIVGDLCATGWNITSLDATSGTVVSADKLDNAADDPTYASQNHWRVSIRVGTFDLIARLHLGPGLDVVRVWRVVGQEFAVPETLLRAENGEVVAALPGCGLSIQLTSGYSTGNVCEGLGFPEGLAELHVPAWSPVIIDIPGWTITGWYGQCGRVVADVGSEWFEQSCDLGGFSPDYGSGPPPGPARFLARPGAQIVQLSMTASSEMGTYSVPMFALVVGE